MITHSGQAIRFGEDQVRAMGRATQGVRGVKLADDDAVVGMDLARDDAQLWSLPKTATASAPR